MDSPPFTQRFGMDHDKSVEDEFPKDAIVGLAHIFEDLNSRSYLAESKRVLSELHRRSRSAFLPDVDITRSLFDQVLEPLQRLRWNAVYDFCERACESLLEPVVHRDDDGAISEEKSLLEVQSYFSKELNLLLSEENMAYQFVEGKFQRRGRAQTQKSIERMGSVLSEPVLANIRRHYNKALSFFNQRPTPDSQNCVKEALCALEAALSHAYGEDFSADFTKSVKGRRGNDPHQIPAPIAEGLIKIHGYRGSGQGVSHAAPNGTRVSELEAELVLNLVASYVTYVIDLSRQEEHNVPF
jgi:hypothetical protein